ncbi:MAG: hypothetical protein WCY42_01320 [Candidatus Omnitrophota bacterium]
MVKRLFFLVFLALLLIGCARMQVTKVDDTNADKAALRFYHSYPYLLVNKSQEGVLESTTIYLPKMNEGYFFNVKSGLGTVNASFELANGWTLTRFGDARDSKIPETINAVSGAASNIAGFIPKMQAAEGVAVAEEEKILRSISYPGLYRYVFDKDGFARGLVEVYILKEEKNN